MAKKKKQKKLSKAEAGSLGGLARKDSLTAKRRKAIAREGGNAVSAKLSDQAKHERASNGGRAAMAAMTPDERSERARAAVAARWARHRAKAARR